MKSMRMKSRPFLNTAWSKMYHPHNPAHEEYILKWTTYVLPCNKKDHCVIAINTPTNPTLLPQILFNHL